MIWLFLTLWALLFFAAVFLINSVPTTEPIPNWGWPLGVTCAAAALLTVLVAGALSLIGVA